MNIYIKYLIESLFDNEIIQNLDTLGIESHKNNILKRNLEKIMSIKGNITEYDPDQYEAYSELYAVLGSKIKQEFEDMTYASKNKILFKCIFKNSSNNLRYDIIKFYTKHEFSDKKTYIFNIELDGTHIYNINIISSDTDHIIYYFSKEKCIYINFNIIDVCLKNNFEIDNIILKIPEISKINEIILGQLLKITPVITKDILDHMPNILVNINGSLKNILEFNKAKLNFYLFNFDNEKTAEYFLDIFINKYKFYKIQNQGYIHFIDNPSINFDIILKNYIADNYKIQLYKFTKSELTYELENEFIKQMREYLYENKLIDFQINDYVYSFDYDKITKDEKGKYLPYILNFEFDDLDNNHKYIKSQWKCYTNGQIELVKIIHSNL